MKKIYFPFLLLISLTGFSQIDTSIVKFRNPTSVSQTKGYSHSAEIDLGNCKMIIISPALQQALPVGGNFFGHSIPNVNFDEILTKNKVALLDYFCIFAL